MQSLSTPTRDPAPMLEQALRQWGGRSDLWVFGYASLIWRPDFDFIERREAHVHGWHRALKMWSHLNRGSPECPGLVFGMFSGGSCRGMVFRVAQSHGREVMARLWEREMRGADYDARWLACRTAQGPVKALAFTLSRSSPHHTGDLSAQEYQRIFLQARGRYGTTHDYAHSTYTGLRDVGIRDTALARLLQLSRPPGT